MKKKSLLALALVFVAAGALILNPRVAQKAYAAVAGMWTYNLFGVRGPLYVFPSKADGTLASITVTTTAYAGASSSGYPTVTGVNLKFLGGMTTAARPACAAGTEGNFFYDVTVHAIAFCDATSWHKLVTGSAANDYWTSY